MDVVEILMVVAVLLYLLRDAIISNRRRRENESKLSEQTQKHFNNENDDAD